MFLVISHLVCVFGISDGEVGEVMPYLVRRAQENSSISGGAAKELKMISAELKRRMGFA